MTTETQPKHTPGPIHIIRTNKPDESDEFAAIGPGGLRAEGFTSTDGALRQALHYANHAVFESGKRLFAAQSIALKQGEAIAQLIRGAELLDDYVMGGSRPPSYDLAGIRAILNDAANSGREALNTKPNACEGINPAAAPDLLAACKAIWDRWYKSLGVYPASNADMEALGAAIAKAEGRIGGGGVSMKEPPLIEVFGNRRITLDPDKYPAAAPDLLAACKAIIAVDDADRSGSPLLSNQGQRMDGYSLIANYQWCAKLARAAIAKAEGRIGGGA